MHLIFVPLTKDNRLSAKEILGNRASLSKWQDNFFAYMAQKYPELERGESARETGRQHIPTRVFKQAVHLTKQAKQIENVLTSINPLNTGKKRDKVIGFRLLQVTSGDIGYLVSDSQTGVQFDVSDAVLDTSDQVYPKVDVLSGTDPLFSTISGLVENNSSLGELQNLMVYNLGLMTADTGDNVSFTGTITVRIPVPSGMSGNIHVFWYDESTKTLKDMNATQSGGYLIYQPPISVTMRLRSCLIPPRPAVLPLPVHPLPAVPLSGHPRPVLLHPEARRRPLHPLRPVRRPIPRPGMECFGLFLLRCSQVGRPLVLLH